VNKNKVPTMISVDEAWRELGGKKIVSRATVYNGVKRGQIPHVRISSRVLIPRQKFLEWASASGFSLTPGGNTACAGARAGGSQ
jgi:excisionase family DNA binding protein